MDFSSDNPKSSNALNLAARCNDVGNVRRLLGKINPNCVDNRGWTCLHEAAYNDSIESLKLILKNRRCRRMVESHEGHTALYVACLNSTSTRSIKYILKHVDDIANYGSREGFTPLHLVSRQGREDVIEMLIRYGAMMDVVDFDGDTPLHEACLGMQHGAVNALLHAGADAEIKNDQEATPLHIACSRGCLKSIKCLLPFISDINALDENGDTPLIAACHGEKQKVILFLLENGADPNVINYRGKLALDYAMEKGLVLAFKKLFEVTNRDKININLILRAVSPNCLNFDIIQILFNSDLDSEYFTYKEPWFSELGDRVKDHLENDLDDASNYEFAPPNCYINICEYIYNISPEKFRECFHLSLMHGMLVNPSHELEMPPLVWLLYCPHDACAREVIDLMVQYGCDVDYCSSYRQMNATTPERVNAKSYHSLRIPDAFFNALLFDPTILPWMLPYSLYCDPGSILEYADKYGFIPRITNIRGSVLVRLGHVKRCWERPCGELIKKTTVKLIKMVDKDCRIRSFEKFHYYVPSLKHLSRMAVRNIMKQKDGTIKTTQQFLEIIEGLPLPHIIKQYLRFK